MHARRTTPATNPDQDSDILVLVILAAIFVLACCCGGTAVGVLWAVIG